MRAGQFDNRLFEHFLVGVVEIGDSLPQCNMIMVIGDIVLSSRRRDSSLTVRRAPLCWIRSMNEWPVLLYEVSRQSTQL
jgi:hypothetical protein